MSYDFVVEDNRPHVGGNIWQGDPLTHSPAVWQYMIDRFAIRSVLDVGSGRGYAAQWFHKAGMQVVAMDASSVNVLGAVYPTIYHDLTLGPLTCPVNLVHCQEVAEHIPEEYLRNFLRTLCNGEVLIMSHATPGQPGYHHVNCQPQEYWVRHMEACGFRFLDIDTDRVRRIALNEGAQHLSRSGLVFAKAHP